MLPVVLGAVALGAIGYGIKKCMQNDECSLKVGDKVYDASEALTKWVEKIEEKLQPDEEFDTVSKSHTATNKRPEHIKDDIAWSHLSQMWGSGDSEAVQKKKERSFMIDMVGNILHDIQQTKEKLQAQGMDYDIEDITAKAIDDMKAKGYGDKPAQSEQTKEIGRQDDIQRQQTNDQQDKLPDDAVFVDNTKTTSVSDTKQSETKSVDDTQIVDNAQSESASDIKIVDNAKSDTVNDMAKIDDKPAGHSQQTKDSKKPKMKETKPKDTKQTKEPKAKEPKGKKAK